MSFPKIPGISINLILGLALLSLTPNQAGAKVGADTIVLGSALSLTGKYSTYGFHTKRGYDVAVRRINETGGVRVGGKTYKLRIIYYDDESTPARGAQLAERLIKQNGVKFMLGPYSSGLTSAIAPITEKYKIPMVESEGTSLSLFNKGYKYLFAVVSTSEEYLTGAVALAAERAKRQGRRPQDVKISMAFEGGIFSQNVRAGAVQAAKRHGLRIVIDDKLPRDLSDMSLTLSKVQAQNPDLLLVSGYSKGAVTAARQIGELNINVPMIAMTHCETSDIINKFGSSVDGVLCPTQWAETLPHHGPTFGSAMDYSKTFKKVYDGYDKSVPYQAAQASAAVLVWKDAFERAQSFDTEKVRNALAATNMETFYGGIKFSQSGNNIGKSMLMREIRNGNFVATALQCAKGTCACAGSNACSKGCCNSQSTNTLSILR